MVERRIDMLCLGGTTVYTVSNRLELICESKVSSGVGDGRDKVPSSKLTRLCMSAAKDDGTAALQTADSMRATLVSSSSTGK